jgi:putative redox protein
VAPALWKKVSVIFHVFGKVDADEAERAAALCMEKYCSVAETMRRGGTSVSREIKVNA